MPISLYTAQFDEICEGWYAELLKESLDDVLVNFEVDTDTRGHDIFAVSNKQSTDIANEF